MDSINLQKSLRRFKVRKYGIISLFVFLMFSNIVTLMQSFNGELFALINSILCIVRFFIYGQLSVLRLKGSKAYSKFLIAIIVIEVFSFVPQVLLDSEILVLSADLLYYMLLDGFSQILVIFLLVDEYVYIQSLHEDISRYTEIIKSQK